MLMPPFPCPIFGAARVPDTHVRSCQKRAPHRHSLVLREVLTRMSKGHAALFLLINISSKWGARWRAALDLTMMLLGLDVPASAGRAFGRAGDGQSTGRPVGS